MPCKRRALLRTVADLNLELQAFEVHLPVLHLLALGAVSTLLLHAIDDLPLALFVLLLLVVAAEVSAGSHSG